MNLSKKILSLLLLIMTTSFLLPSEDLDFYRYRLPDVISHTKNLATEKGEGRYYKSIVFDSNVTVSDAHALTVVTADNLSVHAESSDKVVIEADSMITGVTASLSPNITLTPSSGGSNVTITGNTIVNGNLTVGTGTGGVLVIDGDLIVKGAVTIAANATLTVKGDVVLDGNATAAVSISGTCNVEGIQNPLASGSAIRRGNLVVRNTTGAIMAATLNATGIVTFNNNVSTTAEGITVSGSITAFDVLFQNNVGAIGSASPGFKGVNITGAITATNDITFIENTGGLGSTLANVGQKGGDGVFISGVLSAGMQILAINNQGGLGGAGTGGACGEGGAGVFIEDSLTARDIVLTSNTGGQGGDTNSIGVAGGVGGKGIDVNAGTITARKEILILSNSGGEGGGPAADIGGQGGRGAYINTTLTAFDINIHSNSGGVGAEALTGVGTGGAGGNGAEITSSATVTGKKEIYISDNAAGLGGNGAGTDGTAGNGVLVQGAITNRGGRIVFKGNTTGAAATSMPNDGCVINSDSPIEANELYFVENTSDGTGTTYGVHIMTPNTTTDLDITVYTGIHFVRNEGGDTGKGVLIVGTDANDEIKIKAADMYINVDCSGGNDQNFEIGSNVVLAAMYGSTLTEHVYNPNGCTVDTTL